MINKTEAVKDFEFIKNKAKKYFKNNSFDKSLACVELACRIAYHLNFKYCDDDLEQLMVDFSIKFNQWHDFSNNGSSLKIVFYDCFGLDSRGLTQQYIRALNEWNVPFLYILENDACIEQSKEILQELQNMKHAEILIVSSKLSNLERIKTIGDAIMTFKPNKALLHMSPWDVVGNVVWNAFPSIVKYQINLTDHAFWLGKECSDFFLEFRDYGVNISNKERRIDIEKLLILPYYPIQLDIPFKGFPVSTEGKTVLFSGGSFYKMYGENDTFFKLLKRVLDENDNCIIFIAGSGNIKPFRKFIEENKFEEKIILLGNRTDINAIFRNIDIYISTYPILGALMAQFAAVNKKNIVAYTSSEIPCNFLDGLVKTEKSLTYTKIDDFHKEINHLIANKDYRRNQLQNLEQSVISPKEFNDQLLELIDDPIQNISPNYYNINIDKFSDLYFEMENKYLKTYNVFIFSFAKVSKFKVPVSMLLRSAQYSVSRIIAKIGL